MIDFSASFNHYLIPDYLKEKKNWLLEEWEHTGLEEHFFIFSSGTTSTDSLKSYLLSKKSILNNAKAVNERLSIENGDRWLASLHHYHIGGLSIYARAFLSESDVIPLKSSRFNPIEFTQQIKDDNIQYFSLVPFQLYHIVKSKLKCPDGLKGVLVGGDFLSDSLALKAQDLGWPIYRTYGMTEVCSQIATSKFSKEDKLFIELLPIHQMKDEKLYSSSLLTGTMHFKQNKSELSMHTDSCLTLPDDFIMHQTKTNWIKPLGRKDDYIKIKGRLLNAVDLKNEIQKIFLQFDIFDKIELQMIENSQTGKKIHFLAELEIEKFKKTLSDTILDQLPFLKNCFEFKFVKELPRTGIGKVKRM